MAMAVEIDQLIGGTTGAPSSFPSVAGGSFRWTRDDSNAGSTAIPTPSATNNTNFSWVKSLIVNITAVNNLGMSNVKVGRTAAYAFSGVLVWFCTARAYGSYVPAVSGNMPPTDPSTRNATAPSINSNTTAPMPLLSAASVYAPGTYNTINRGNAGNIVEMVLGVDDSNTTAGTTSVCTLRWQWTEG